MKQQSMPRYTMRIERKIVDKLGLKLYDKIAAVVAETIANSYDADAELVTVRLPLGKALAVRKKGKIEQKGYVIEIHDNGHGMTPEEANEFYLRVGKDRREDQRQGDRSRRKNRPVMGRKGIGKLAPFGVCRTIEIRSAGGAKTAKGFMVTHFELDYDKIIEETSEEDNEYHPAALKEDGTWDKKPGTMVRLKNFLPKDVPDKETFNRQLSYRFGLTLPDFKIKIVDTKKENREKEFFIGKEDIPLMEGTKMEVDNIPVVTEDGKKLPVRGWVGMSKRPYKNIEFAGVRIYVRGKIASITRDFGLPSGFTGEFVARSYLVGEVHADWIDEEEDLIQTHRQDILWASELGQAFSKWGQEIIKKVAKRGSEPRRKLVRERFLEVSKLRETAHKRFKDEELIKTTIELGEKIGSFASEEELEDKEYVEGLADIILTFAPHKLLVDTLKEIHKLVDKEGKVDFKMLVKLFETSRIAQLTSYGQIVTEKLKVVDTFEKAIRSIGIEEKELQSILEDAPWVIDPRWEVMTANQSFKSFREAFEAWYKGKYGKDIMTSTNPPHRTRRPDFILIHAENGLKVVEIKPPKHAFNDEDWDRLNAYHDAVQEFMNTKGEFKEIFPKGFQIILITDNVKITNSSFTKAMEHLKSRGNLIIRDWEALLYDTKIYHRDFLSARDEFELS